MTTMNRELYDALLEAGASEDKAGDAAVSMTEADQATKGDVIRAETNLKASITKLEKEMMVMKWMIGLVLATTTIPLIKQFLD